MTKVYHHGEVLLVVDGQYYFYCYSIYIHLHPACIQCECLCSKAAPNPDCNHSFGSSSTTETHMMFVINPADKRTHKPVTSGNTFDISFQRKRKKKPQRLAVRLLLSL